MFESRFCPTHILILFFLHFRILNLKVNIYFIVLYVFHNVFYLVHFRWTWSQGTDYTGTRCEEVNINNGILRLTAFYSLL